MPLIDAKVIFSVTKSGIIVLPKHKEKFVIMVSEDLRMKEVYIARTVPTEIVETNLDFDVSDIDYPTPVFFPILTNKELFYPLSNGTLKSLKYLFKEVEDDVVYDPNLKLYFSKTRLPLPENFEYLGRGYLFGETYHLYRGGN